MTQKELRKLARVALAKYLTGRSPDLNLANLAVAVLHAPTVKGE